MLENDFLPKDPEQRTRRHTIFVAVVFTLLVAVIAGLGASASYRSITNGKNGSSLSMFEGMKRLVFGGDLASTTSTTPKADDRMNLMLLGIGGPGHEGSELTDTIIFASVDTTNKKVGMLSIPRDLAYPLDGGRFEKINALNAYAEQDHPGQGAAYASEAIGSLLQVPVDHYIKVNFKGFADLVDALGGISVNVEHTFTDTQYPTDDYLWTTISFKKGLQIMDGKTALTYVRSRHGNNGEGSDFARSRRQQLVLLGIRQKLLSLGTLTDPKKMATIYSALSRNLQTDLSVWDVIKYAPMLKDFTKENIVSNVLTDAPDGDLVAANVDGAYMLLPRDRDWSQIREIAKNPFQTKAERLGMDVPKTPVQIELRNGTTRTGFAAQVAAKLEQAGYDIGQFGNASKRGFERSVVFDLTSGKKSDELSRLKNLLNADVSVTHPTFSTDNRGLKVSFGDGQVAEYVSSSSTDFLVVLGEASAAFANSTYGNP